MVTKYNVDDTVYIKGTVSMIKIGKGGNGVDLTYNVKVKDSPGSTAVMVMREQDIIAGDTRTIVPVDIGTLRNLRDSLGHVSLNRVNGTSSDGDDIINECRAILTHLIIKHEEEKNDKL